MTKNKKERLFRDWLKDCERISKATVVEQIETQEQKQTRIARLQKNFVAFCKYYFPHYMDDGKTDMGWFHRKAAKEIVADPDIFAVLEWPREHAKSVFANVFVPMFLKATEDLTGMMVGSANQEKASGLLKDIHAELVANQRFISDYGQQHIVGSWLDGHFSTADSIGFWAFGRGQSPRGARESANRPNYGVIDDIDDKVIVKNQQRVTEAVDWVLGDFFGGMSIRGARLVIAGNRIHKKSILAHLVGDIEPEDPKNPEVFHLKVFALENPRTRKKDMQGQPAWKERYSIEMLQKKMRKYGRRNALREFFHEHIVEGIIFKNDNFIWAELPPLKKANAIVTYNDPSFKDTKKNDFKAILLLAMNGKYIDVYKAWVRQETPSAMVRGHYDMAEDIGDLIARHYMEANFMQDSHLESYETEGEKRGWQLPLRADKRKKPHKEERIEELEPLFERHLVRFNIKEKHSPDMQELVNQFLSFPHGHDDGPDAFEGGLHYLKKMKKGKRKPRTGKAQSRGRSRKTRYRN